MQTDKFLGFKKK